MSSNSHLALPLPTTRRDGLPTGKLLAFTLAGFLTIMTETLPAGLLPQISAGLHITTVQAGQLITVYALGSVLAAIPLVAITRSWQRRPLFLLAIAGLLLFNTLTAWSENYPLTLVARFIAGMAAGVIWGLMAGYVRRMVTPQQQGRALAIAGLGQPVALAIGFPLGTWLGSLTEWRTVFWMMSALALLLVVWIRLAVPDFAGQTARQRLTLRQVATLPGIRPILLTLFVWILAHNLLYTYIAPFLIPAGLAGRVDAVLLLFGLCSVIGIAITGLLVDRWLRNLTLLSLGLFCLAALLPAFAPASPAMILAGVILWGLTFGGAPTLLQTALADRAGEAADMAQSMLVTLFNLAVAGGGLLGGLLLIHGGPVSLPLTMVMLALGGLVIVWRASAHGFTPGHRAS